jgi:UDP-N-acetylglucosamine 1-carboxyvinyltransferase
MAAFVIEGGAPLKGSVTPDGNKNEALPALMACLLTDQTVTLRRMPKIGDVLTVCDILRGMGVQCEWLSDDSIQLNAAGLSSHEPDPHLCAKVRASILLLGPLLARRRAIKLALPGGDVIGARRIDTHWEGISGLGAELKLGAYIEGTLKQFCGTDIYFDEPSVTATENVLMMATLARGTTTIHNAACEPHVVGLCQMLVAMGADISGIGSNRLNIVGKESGLGGCTHEIGPDFMEVGSFLCLAAASGGQLEINRVRMEDYRFILKTFSRLGIEPTIDGHSLSIHQSCGKEVGRDLSGRVATIYSGPWPAFPTDLMSVTIVAATQQKGTVIFFEKMFEGRMFFTDKLMQMGANIVLCDPHRIVVTGPAPLYAAEMSSPDVRAGMSLVIAGLVAKGTSKINNIYQIERGYFRIEEKLLRLGAKIKRVE